MVEEVPGVEVDPPLPGTLNAPTRAMALRLKDLVEPSDSLGLPEEGLRDASPEDLKGAK